MWLLYPTTSPGLTKDTTSSSRSCFPFLLRHQTHRYYSCQAKTKAHNIPKFNFLPLHGMSEKQLASWAWGRRLAPEESSQQMTQLQLPPERQLVGTANQVARGCRILPSNLHYTSFTTLLQNTKSKQDACVSQAFYRRQVGINYMKPSFTSNSLSARLALLVILVLKQLF